MNIPARLWTTLTAFIGILIALAAILIVKETKSIAYVGVNPDTLNTITVDGTGDAVAIPDVATFSFSVSETGKTVALAQSAATDKINAALKSVRAAGVADKDISTDSYSINPHYEYSGGVCTANFCPPSKQVLTGYDVSESIQVKIRDLAKAGDIFTSIGSLGVQNVNGLSFSIDDPASVQAAARRKAIADAQSKAKELAKELGVSLVRVASFTENNNSYPRPIMYAMDAKVSAQGSAPMAPEIPAGQQKVTDTVEITYVIK
jgi:hypothetical protein